MTDQSSTRAAPQGPLAGVRIIDLTQFLLGPYATQTMGDLAMAFVYLVPFFPLFLAYGRARIEWEAYTETLRATAEVYGIDAAERLHDPIVSRFVGGEYGWMWPFPRTIHRWFDEAIAQIALVGPPSDIAESRR